MTPGERWKLTAAAVLATVAALVVGLELGAMVAAWIVATVGRPPA